MIDLIGLPLNEVLLYLENKGLESQVILNNFCVEEDVKLVTNVKTQGDKIVLTVGEFIFNIKEQSNE